MFEALEILFAQFPAHKTEGSEEARLAGYRISLDGVDPRDLRSAVERLLTDTERPTKFCPTGPEIRALCESERRRRMLVDRPLKALPEPVEREITDEVKERVAKRWPELETALAKAAAKTKKLGPVTSRFDGGPKRETREEVAARYRRVEESLARRREERKQ